MRNKIKCNIIAQHRYRSFLDRPETPVMLFVNVKPRIHDAAGCTTGCTTGWTNYVNELNQKAQPSGLVTAG